MYTPKGELNDELLKLVQDPEKVMEFIGLTTPEEGLAVAKKYIPDITLEEFQKSMQIMSSYLEENKDGLLSDEDLDSVAGGKVSTETIVGILGGVAATTGAVAGVAGAVAATWTAIGVAASALAI